jgi:hypothetical protein
MERKSIVVVAALAVLVGCSSSPGGSACPVDGTYSVTSTLNSSTCMQTGSPNASTYTFITAKDGTVSMVIGGLQGSCDGNKLNGCHLTVACDVSSTETVQGAFTFTPSGFSGPMSATASSPSCTINVDQTGVRQ